MDSSRPNSGPRRPETCRATGGLILLAAPFYLNDFSSIFIQDWRLWLAIDYFMVKLVPICGAVWLIRSGTFSCRDLGFRSLSIRGFSLWALALTLACTLMDQNLYPLLAGLPGYPPLGGMPAIPSPIWDWIDLTAGLALVAFCEELVFRGFLYALFKRLGPMAIVVLSSLAFGLAHWCLGLHAVLITGLIGAVLMAAYVRIRSIYPLILAHFLVNFIDFSGAIPKSIFQFF